MITKQQMRNTYLKVRIKEDSDLPTTRKPSGKYADSNMKGRRRTQFTGKDSVQLNGTHSSVYLGDAGRRSPR
jgi:hypothetical protein